MITLITGLPGASKTLNTLAMVEKECKGRAIYYYGIPDLKLPWIELSLDQLHTWWDLPIGSVIVVDEAQDPTVWPAIPNSKLSPESVTRMDQHRKGGYDFFVITQMPTKIDHRLRGFAGPHFHYERVFSRNGAKETRFERAVSDPFDRTARASSQTRWVSFNKQFFDKYKSAEIHTYKPKIPRAVYVAAAGIVIASVMAYRLFASPGVQEEIQHEASTIQQQLHDLKPEPVEEEGEGMTAEQYAAQFTPRIPDIPHSAPAYDNVTQVQTYPRPQCILREKTETCKCYTQQATPLDVSHEMCMAIVEGGWFNPFVAESSGAGITQAEPAERVPAPTLVHLDSEPARLPYPDRQPAISAPAQVDIADRHINPAIRHHATRF